MQEACISGRLNFVENRERRGHRYPSGRVGIPLLGVQIAEDQAMRTHSGVDQQGSSRVLISDVFFRWNDKHRSYDT